MNQKIDKLLKKENGNYIFPFFWLHGETEETLRKYMKVIYESNIRAVCVESRPHPDFCGEKWWKDMDVILDEARKRKMRVWILDDSHFPTGYANGAMEGKPDKLCRQSICCRVYEPKGKRLKIGKKEVLHPDDFVKSMIENYALEKTPREFDDDRLFSLYAVRCDDSGVRFYEESDRIDLMPFLKNDELDWEIPKGKWKVYALHLSRNHGYHRSYINMMNRDSCKVLLDAVYEPHYQHYKEDFGTTIAGFFSDEPELGNGHMYEMNDSFGTPNDYPWSDELEKELESRLGADYHMLMALLWETEADKEVTAKVRYVYMDVVTRLVEKNFSRQIGDWCRTHGVEYIGHLIEDDNHHTRTGSSLGHYFRGLAGQDMAGIDDIGGQVFPQGEDINYDEGIFQHRNGEFYHYMLGKLGSSAAAIEPQKKGNSMCEIFGNYGWTEGVRLEKYLADHFLVRGINHYVPHAFSPKEFPDPDCPPHFYAHGHNPQYRHFGCLMSYVNRMCELISGGRHIAPVAVLYHAEGDWTGRHMTADKIGHCLADSQIEYDFIPQDVFADQALYHTKAEGGSLWVNTQEYKAVVVPYMQYVTEAFAEAVIRMKKEGIPVWFVDGCPEGICDTETGRAKDREQAAQMQAASRVVKLENLAADLKKGNVPEIRLEPADDRIRYHHYMHEDGTSVFLFVNEGIEEYRGNVHFLEAEKAGYGEMVMYRYDAWENHIEPLEMKNGSISLVIEPLKSQVAVFDRLASMDEIQKIQISAVYDAKETVAFSGRWKRSICESIAYPQFEKEKEICLPDMLEEEEPLFSGFVRYKNKFVLEKAEPVWLEITDAYEGVEVFVNGVSQGIQIVPVFRYDISSAVKAGENEICIEVATTLERKMSTVPNMLGQTVEAKSMSGIKGEVRLWKYGKNYNEKADV